MVGSTGLLYGYISWCGNSETDVTNKPRSIKGKVELGHSFNWTCHLIFDNTLWQCTRMDKKEEKKSMNELYKMRSEIWIGLLLW